MLFSLPILSASGRQQNSMGFIGLGKKERRERERERKKREKRKEEGRVRNGNLS